MLPHQARAVKLLSKEPVRRIITIVAGLFALLGLYHLLRNLYFASDEPGYDFRYPWLAGRMWVEGRNPYGSDYLSTGSALFRSGHVPEIWAYPPHWWPIASGLGLTDFKTAGQLWNFAGITLCFASSFLVVRAFQWAYSDSSIKSPVCDFLIVGGLAVALLHFAASSALEATTLVIVLGQTAILIYFGIALLLYGIAKDSRPICVTALSIIFLKPHIGLGFAALFLVYSRWSRQTLAWAIAICALLAIPALIIDPHFPLDLVRNIGRYDSIGASTLPRAMTGVRLAVWQAFGMDIGNLVSAIIATGVVVVVSLTLRLLYEQEDERRVLWLCTTVATAITIALAPLHYYDFVIIACLVPAVLVSSAQFTSAALLGAALIVRADTLGKLTGFYEHNVGILERSLFATAGGFLLLIGALGAARRTSFERRAAGQAERPR